MTAKGNQSISETNAETNEEPINDEELDDFDDEEGGRRLGDVYIPPPPSKPAYSGEETGIRLIITHIENINFKSYANRQVLGPFHKSFTSIVGPNGSGKSNVIDSMLFVFGYRAQKLRSKKLSVLIHNSDLYPNLTFCKVIVHFSLINDKPGDDYDIVPGSEFTVSRTAHKDNSSYYCIDDKKVKFIEVSKLLSSHGIDLRYNRFLILQGEVEQIALMKPKADKEGEAGMLEFLEDIIGTTRLKEPLSKLAQKVEEKNEIRAERLNRASVAEKEMKALQRAKDDAITFLKAENNITLQKAKLYQTYRSDANTESEAALVEYNRAQDIYDKALNEINELKTQREDTEKEQQLMAQEFSAVSKRADDLKEKFQDCERRDVQLRDKHNNIKNKGKKLDKSIDEENHKLEDLMKMPDKYSKEIQVLEGKKEKVSNDLTTAEQHLEVAMGEIKDDTEPLQNRKDRIEGQLVELNKGVNEKRSQMEIAKHELEIYLSEEQTHKTKLQTMEYKLNKSISDAKDKRTALQALETEIPSTETKCTQIKEEIEKFEEKKNRLTEEHRNTNTQLMSLRHSAVDTTSRNRVLNALMDQKKKGSLRGILGRLGDLGAVDKKYDIAVSTACGPLDNIVCETIDDATECVNFLKKNSIGSAKFIALDKMSQRYQWSEGQSYPEGVPRLFDLIRVNDERVRVAFYHGLRDTLLANDIEQGSRISCPKNSNRRHRVVTLKGQLFETAGTMSGGGRPSSGRIGSSVAVTEIDESEIRGLEEEVNRLQQKINEIHNRLGNLRTDSDKLYKDLSQMKQNKPKFELEVKEFDKMQTELKKSITEQKEKLKKAAPDSKRVKELEARARTETEKFENEEKKCTKYNEELQDLEQKITEIMDKKVGTARRRVDELKTQLKRINTDLSKANVGLTTCERNIDKSKEKIESLDKERNETLEALKTNKADIKALEEEAKHVSNDYEEVQQERDKSEVKLKAIGSKIKSIKAQEVKLNNENIDAKHECEQQKCKLNEKESEVKRFTQMISALELHKIDAKTDKTIPELSAEDIEKIVPKELEKEIDGLDKELKKMTPNMSSIEEYKKKEDIFLERSKQLTEITAQRDLFDKQFKDISQQRLNEFKDGFVTIARKLKEMYRMITMGGDAELEFIDGMDPFSEGINFTIRPNKKTWKKISNLSGGEKTLSSLALIFALHYYKPSPLYVMDEIDAALDFKNVSIVANYIKQRTRNTQFVIISLRNNMYELADRLVGIYKTNNCTKSVTINPNIIEEKRIDRRTIALSSTNTANNECASQPIANGVESPDTSVTLNNVSVFEV